MSVTLVVLDQDRGGRVMVPGFRSRNAAVVEWVAYWAGRGFDHCLLETPDHAEPKTLLELAAAGNKEASRQVAEILYEPVADLHRSIRGMIDECYHPLGDAS